jgi:hypothetical protein
MGGQEPRHRPIGTPDGLQAVGEARLARAARVRAFLRTTRGRVTAAVVATGAVLGLLTNALDLRDRLFPEKAVNVNIRVGKDPEVNVRAGRWAEEHPSAFKPNHPALQTGVVYGVQVRAEGLDGDAAALNWEVRDDFTGQAVEPFPWAPPSMPFTPDDDPWQDTLEVFVPVPPVTRMRVIFTVVHDDNVVATGRTTVLAAGGSRR